MSTTSAPPLGLRLRRARTNYAALCAIVAAHLLALASLAQPIEVSYLILATGIYVWGMLGVTLYLHRSLAHRALTLAEPLKFALALGVAVCLAGDPAGWVAIHRKHHGSADTDDDVHSPRHGIGHSYFGWMLKLTRETADELLRLSRDVQETWYCRWMQHPAIYLMPHAAAVAAVGWYLGPGGVLWGLYVPIVLAFHSVNAVNSVCHLPRFGYRRHETADDSRNVPWLSFLTFGESFHNNHHAHPHTARQGDAWYEPDLTAYVIWVLEKLRLARNVVR